MVFGWQSIGHLRIQMQMVAWIRSAPVKKKGGVVSYIWAYRGSDDDDDDAQ
jgi:hypothetical protein